MSIYDKIEEIRQKPEHIRMRYVWAMVAISMVFVLGIWFVSLAGQNSNKPSLTDDLEGTGLFDQLSKPEMPTMPAMPSAPMNTTDGFQSTTPAQQADQTVPGQNNPTADGQNTDNQTVPNPPLPDTDVTE